MTKTIKSRFEALMYTKIESDFENSNPRDPSEGMSKLSLRIPTGDLNVLDFMAKTLDTTRQDILIEILRPEIENAYQGMTAHLEMEDELSFKEYLKVRSGELKDGHNA
jgi:hypothetical protein